MPLVKSGTFGSSPAAEYAVYADQIGGSGHNRTISIGFQLKVKGSTNKSYYGYPLSWKAIVNGSYSGAATIKGSEYWYATDGFRTFHQTMTVNVGTTSSKTISCGFQLIASGSWSQTITGNFTVGQTNTAPYFPNGNKWINVREGHTSSGRLLSGIIPENISQVYVDWGAAADSEGDSLTYALNHKINDGNWVQIDLGDDRAHSYAIGAGNEGQRIQYYVDARDPSGAWSEKIYSSTLTKNVLTGGWFTGHSNDITHGTDSFTLSFTGGKNSNGTPVYYHVYSDDIPIQNGREVTTTSETIKIWNGSGTAPSTPYFKLSDIRNFVKNNNYVRALHVGLRTRNDYNTYKWSGGSVSVDLRANPNASNCYISEDSSAYRTINGTKYMIPESGQRIHLDFKAATGKNDESIYYEIYYSINNKDWIYLKKGYDSTWKSGNDTWHTVHHDIGRMYNSGTIKYLVRVKTSYDYYSDTYSDAKTFHYYHGVTLVTNKVNRSQTTAEVTISVKSATSLPKVETKGNWSCNGATGSFLNTGVQYDGTLNVPLKNESQQTLSITYNDNTGLTANQTVTVQIPAFAPIFFINKYGAGVGGIKATANHSFVVKGHSFLHGKLGQCAGTITNFNTALAEGEYTVGGNNLTGAPTSGNLYGKLVVKVSDGGTHDNKSNWIWQIFYRTESTLVYRRSKTNDGSWTSWCVEHDTNYKPSPMDIGAVPLTGGTMTGNLVTTALQIKGTDAYLNKHTLRLEKGYDGHYSQIFFKGQENDDGRIVHWESGNASQLWLMPSDDIDVANDEVILGTIANKNGTTDLDGAQWNRAFSFKMDGTLEIRKKSSSFDLNGLYHESVCLANDSTPNRPENWCYVRSFGCGNGYTMQLASYYGQAARYYIRGQSDQPKWKEWESIITSDHRNIYKLRAAGSYMHVETSGSAKGVNWWESDMKFKQNIQPITVNTQNDALGSETPGLDLINKIEHYSFDYDEEHEGKHIDCGYVAQQLEEIDERLINKIEQKEDSKYYSEDDIYTRQPNETIIIPYLSKAIQELYIKNLELEKQVRELQSKTTE